MVYHADKEPRRGMHRTRLQRRTPPGLDDAKTQFILEVAAKHGGATPADVAALIRNGHRRADITTAMVRYVLTQPSGG